MAERQPDSVKEAAVAYDESRRKQGSRIERLKASGRLKPAKLDLVDLGYPPEAPHEMSISEALNEQRSER